MANTVGSLIKEARTKKKLTQQQLADLVEGVTASDISKAERGEKELSQAALKQIAKATGVTQASLLNAAKETETGAKKPAASAKKTSAAKKTEEEIKLTAAEKKLLEAYRAADKETREKALKLLKGEKPDGGEIVSDLLGTAMDFLGNLKK